MRSRASLALLALLSALTVTSARAERAAAVATALPRSLLLFDTAAPALVTVRELTGLGTDESIVGIDLRPATGELFAFTVVTGSAANSVISTYVVDPETGVATLVGVIAAALVGAGDVPSGVDFNPVVDRVRIVNTNDENARVNPSTGALTSNDMDLTPAAVTDLIGAAYDRNTAGAGPTTLYAINRNGSQLAVVGGIDGVPSPNGGIVTNIGSLGVTLAPARDGGFDIAASGTAYAALTAQDDDRTRLYTVDLATGQATAIGDLPVLVRSLTILPDASPPVGLVDVGDRPRLKTLQDAGLVLGFGCNEACTATATLTARKVGVARGEGTLGGAGVGQLTLTVVAEGEKALRRARRAGRLRGTLTLALTDTAGNASTSERQLVLRR